MYSTLLLLHSWFRWVAVLLLAGAIVAAWSGLRTGRAFSRADNALRHWTATAAHLQLVLGILLYLQSPVVRFFFSAPATALQHRETLFFSLVHSVLMVGGVVVVTIGSALAKRRLTDAAKFKTMFLWFLLTFVILLVAIPWPFSPLATRPLIR